MNIRHPARTARLLSCALLACFATSSRAATWNINSAQSNSGVDAPKPIVITKATTTPGNYNIITTACAIDDGGTDGKYISSTPATAKTSLTTTQPTIGGAANSKGADWVRSDATAPNDSATANATADAWINGGNYQFDLTAYARVKKPGGIEAVGTSGVLDPFSMEWDPFDWPDSLLMGWNVGTNTRLDIGGPGHASMSYTSLLDFGNDGSSDQLFWKLTIDSRGTLDLMLGNGVSIVGGYSDTYIESLLAPGGYAGGSWSAPSDLSVSFKYDLINPGYSTLGISYEASIEADAVPDGSGAANLLLGFALLCVLRRVGWRR